MTLHTLCSSLLLRHFPNQIELAERFRDVDARHHINNIAVAELFSEARAHCISALFQKAGRPDRTFFVVGQQAIFYADEARFPGRIDIGSEVFALGRKTIRFGQAVFNEGRCTALADAILVCTKGGQSAELTDEFRSEVAKLQLPVPLLPRQLASLQ
jgi:acyl-CoA thioester hydrolase